MSGAWKPLTIEHMFAIVKDMDIHDRAKIKRLMPEDHITIKEGLDEATVAVGRAEWERLRWILKFLNARYDAGPPHIDRGTRHCAT